MRLTPASTSRGKILLIIVLIALPIIHKQAIALISDIERNLIEMVAVKSFIDGVVRCSPDVATPIELVVKCGIITRNGRDHILAPELFRVQ